MVILKVLKIIVFEVKHWWASKIAISHRTDAFTAEVCTILVMNLRMKVLLRWMWR